MLGYIFFNDGTALENSKLVWVDFEEFGKTEKKLKQYFKKKQVISQ